MKFQVIAPRMQRSHGRAAISLRHDGTRVRLVDMHQSGSAKVLMPHVGTLPEIVFLNTSGGLAGGDTLRYDIRCDAGVQVVATTQTAERAYRADGRAAVKVTARVGDGGWLDWLPQETILFDQSAVDRDTIVHLAGDAGCLLLETIVLGRSAMGETVGAVHLTDRRKIYRDGRLVAVEHFAFDDTALTAGAACLGDDRAVASLIMVGAGVADRVDAVRQTLVEPGVTAAASGFDGRLTVRMMAADGWPLRKQIIRVLAVLRDAPLPRVWQDFGVAA